MLGLASGLFWFKSFRLKLPILLQQDFHLAFCIFQFLAAGCGELHALFKQRQGLLQRHFALFPINGRG